MTFRARFTISLRQRKPSFGAKKRLSGFTKDTQREISTENVWTVIFATHLIEYTFVGVFLSIWKVMGGEYLNQSRKAIY